MLRYLKILLALGVKRVVFQFMVDVSNLIRDESPVIIVVAHMHVQIPLEEKGVEVCSRRVLPIHLFFSAQRLPSAARGAREVRASVAWRCYALLNAAWYLILPLFPLRASGCSSIAINTSSGTSYSESIPNREEGEKPKRG